MPRFKSGGTHRIYTYRGLTIAEALEKPLRGARGKTAKRYTFDGRTGSLSDLYKHFGWEAIMSLNLLRKRIRAGMSLEASLTAVKYQYQREHVQGIATGKQRTYVARRKPTHPADIIAAYMGRCQACGALLLKQSIVNGVCEGGC